MSLLWDTTVWYVKILKCVSLQFLYLYYHVLFFSLHCLINNDQVVVSKPLLLMMSHTNFSVKVANFDPLLAPMTCLQYSMRPLVNPYEKKLGECKLQILHVSEHELATKMTHIFTKKLKFFNKLYLFLNVFLQKYFDKFTSKIF